MHQTARPSAIDQLRAIGSILELSTKLGVARTTVQRWLNGSSTPSAERQAEIQEKLGVPIEAWSGAPDSIPDPPPSDGPVDELATAKAHLARAEHWRALAITGTEKARAFDAERKAIELVARLAGSMSVQLTDEAIAKHPHFRRTLAAIVSALKPYPEATAAVLSALESLGAGAGGR